tara:strand:+ start:651 stop:1586 length:936 start_codon:yes stop_codon:yes gene_type:complete
MKLYKPNFWKETNLVSILLFPISLIVKLIILMRKTFTKELEFEIPVICVGNIYLGGTGKTPLSINLGKELSILNKKPVIIRKYYKHHKDEYSLIRENFKHLITKKDRKNAIKNAVQNGFDTVILDDGFQDYKIKKNLNIVCFNNQLLGNGMLIPAGPLRESVDSLKSAHIIIINGDQNIDFERKLLEINNEISIFYSRYQLIDIEKYRGKKLFVIAGIGNPENFFELIRSQNLNIIKELSFPDHYQFSKSEILNIINDARKNGYQVVMTEKDYHRVKDYNFTEIHYMKVKLEIAEKKEFLNKVLTVYDKKN